MKKPRFDYFPTTDEPKKPVKPLHSPLDSMPTINPPRKREEPTPENDNVYKSTNQQTDKSTSGQVDKSTNPLTDKSTNPLINKSTKRFTTYLTDESIKAMKRLALETDKKDYELFQEAVDKYLRKRG